MFLFLDPNTVHWLKRNLDKVFGFPEIVRFSWSSCARMLDEEAVSVDWNERDEEDEPSGAKKAKRKRINQSVISEKKTPPSYLTAFKVHNTKI